MQELSNANLVDYFNQLSDNVAVCAPDGLIVFVNEAWQRFSSENGYAGPDFVGQNYLEVCRRVEGVEQSHAATVCEGLQALSSGEVPFFSHIYPCHASHEHRWFKLLATRSGNRLALQHQQIVQHGLNQTDELKELPDHLMAERDAQTAHDIKTALNGVMGFVQIAKLDIESGSDLSTVGSRLADAEEAGWQLNRFLEGMLFRSTLLMGKSDFEQQSVDIEAAARACANTLKSTAQGIDIEIISNLSGSLRLLANAEAIDRIFFNLISNAIKFNRENGWVKITLDRNRSNGISIYVSDSGIGIPQDALPRIFDNFRREKEAAQQADGKGLGLAIVKELVGLLDGTLNVTSRVNEGTKFDIQFPSWRTVSAD